MCLSFLCLMFQNKIHSEWHNIAKSLAKVDWYKSLCSAKVFYWSFPVGVRLVYRLQARDRKAWLNRVAKTWLIKIVGFWSVSTSFNIVNIIQYNWGWPVGVRLLYVRHGTQKHDLTYWPNLDWWKSWVSGVFQLLSILSISISIIEVDQLVWDWCMLGKRLKGMT